jgi:arginine:ornithine antiporter/lysine permease
VLLSALLHAPGAALYFWARRERNACAFTPVELIILLVVVIGARARVRGLATGYITI